MQFEYIKVVLVGEARVGKTKAVKELKGFSNTNYQYTPTLGVEVRNYTSSGGLVYNIWDTAGDSRFGGLTRAYYTQADIVCICGCLASSKEGKKWKREVISSNIKANAKIYYLNQVNKDTLSSCLP